MPAICTEVILFFLFSWDLTSTWMIFFHSSPQCTNVVAKLRMLSRRDKFYFMCVLDLRKFFIFFFFQLLLTWLLVVVWKMSALRRKLKPFSSKCVLSAGMFLFSRPAMMCQEAVILLLIHFFSSMDIPNRCRIPHLMKVIYLLSVEMVGHAEYWGSLARECGYLLRIPPKALN